ncbi:hypothetical protein GCM10025869_35840 [Homoserinibacter gongjuensis]|uniref:Uncharacterized protein n=1 Tax=Homoserinibacter gongjuensis TaxID=1162968 RepID=A0ABQ6K1W2_9MICO|nr:hypothetical protein GCM10025869_35840 [Homoserinibacter gongjuensis]
MRAGGAARAGLPAPVTELRLARIPGVSLSSQPCPSGRTDTQEPIVRTNTETYAGTRGLVCAQPTAFADSPQRQH